MTLYDQGAGGLQPSMEETVGMCDAVGAGCRMLWGFEGLQSDVRCAVVDQRGRAVGLEPEPGGKMADIVVTNRTGSGEVAPQI